MRRLLTHLLLSVALIFQGLGGACAHGPMSPDMGSQTMGSLGMTDSAQACMVLHACHGCPGNNMAAQTCMQSCGLPAGLPSVPFPMSHVSLVDALALPAKVSLLDYIQVPPTPPPIA